MAYRQMDSTCTIDYMSNTPFPCGFYCLFLGSSDNKPSSKILALTQAYTQETTVLGLYCYCLGGQPQRYF